MTEQDEAFDEQSEEQLRKLVKGALRDGDAGAPDVLGGVQRKLRERSRGKFYADGWSTTRHPPIATYLLTSLLMLAIVVVVYALLSPLAGEPEAAPEIAPVRVVPPRTLTPEDE
jgi:hypothetical protein